MKKLLLGSAMVAALALAGCGEPAVDDSANAEFAVNETMNAVDDEALEASPDANNSAEADEGLNDVAADAADAAKDAASAAAEAAANKM